MAAERVSGAAVFVMMAESFVPRGVYLEGRLNRFSPQFEELKVSPVNIHGKVLDIALYLGKQLECTVAKWVGGFLFWIFSLFDLDIPTSCSILFTDFRTVFFLIEG